MPASEKTRHYVHGDQNDQKKYFCAACGLFVDESHFNARSECQLQHNLKVDSHYEYYQKKLKSWKKRSGKSTMYRPAQPMNYFE